MALSVVPLQDHIVLGVNECHTAPGLQASIYAIDFLDLVGLVTPPLIASFCTIYKGPQRA